MSGRELLQAAFEQGGFPIYLTAMSDESLRDYFAEGAMESFTQVIAIENDMDYEIIARHAYEQADAMMKERKRREGGKDAA